MPENLFKFSVITPTFRGREKIRVVFESLKSQTYNDFEWLVVMDGFDKETSDIINCFIEEKANFPIRLLSIDHNHKKAAMNRGIKEAQGELILIADDDDSFVPDALEIFESTWSTIDDKESFVGVTGLCVYEDGSVVGDRFPQDVFDATTLECTLKHRVKGEKWGFQRRDIMLEYPFFEDAEGYVGESTVWFEIGKKYKTRYVNRELRVYNQTENSIIREPLTSGKVERNCQAYTYGYLYSASQVDVSIMLRNPRFFLACCINYVRYMMHSISLNKYKSWMSPIGSMSKVRAVIIGSPGVFFYLRDIYNFKKID